MHPTPGSSHGRIDEAALCLPAALFNDAELIDDYGVRLHQDHPSLFLPTPLFHDVFRSRALAHYFATTLATYSPSFRLFESLLAAFIESHGYSCYYNNSCGMSVYTGQTRRIHFVLGQHLAPPIVFYSPAASEYYARTLAIGTARPPLRATTRED